MRRLRRIPLLWIVLVLQVVDQITVETGHVLALLVVVQIIVDKNNKRRYSCNKHLIINAYGPNEYKKMITLSAKLEEKGLNSQQAQMEAFYESIGAKH